MQSRRHGGAPLCFACYVALFFAHIFPPPLANSAVTTHGAHCSSYRSAHNCQVPTAGALSLVLAHCRRLLLPPARPRTLPLPATAERPPTMPASPAHQDEPPIEERAATVLHWLQVEQAGPLARARCRPRRRKGEPALAAIAALLADGVVLAEVLVGLDALPHASVLRAVRRPASSPDATRAVDARQTQHQYKHNTRRVVHAIRKILEHLRGAPLPAGALQEYMGADVAHTAPRANPAPALRLVELVIAAAMYGPRCEHFVWAIWHMPCENTKRTLHAIIARIAHFFNLLPFDALVHQICSAYQGIAQRSSASNREDAGNIGDRKLSLVTDDGRPSTDAQQAPQCAARSHPHSPVQLAHPDHHDFHPSNSPGLTQLSDDSELMSHKYAYNEANARLQEVARARALVTRLEGSVMGARGMFPINNAVPSAALAEPPPAAGAKQFSPLPQFTDFHAPLPLAPDLPASRAIPEPPQVSLPTLDRLDRALDKVPEESYAQAAPKTKQEDLRKDTEFSTDDEGEAIASAARRVSGASDESGTIPSLPIFPPAASATGIVPPLSGVSPPPDAAEAPSSNRASSQVNLRAAPSLLSTRIFTPPSSARSSREGGRRAFDVSTSKITNVDETEVVENEIVVTDEDEQVSEYVEGDEALFTSSVTAPSRSSDDIVQVRVAAPAQPEDARKSSGTVKHGSSNQQSASPPSSSAALHLSMRGAIETSSNVSNAPPAVSQHSDPSGSMPVTQPRSVSLASLPEPPLQRAPPTTDERMAPPPAQPAQVITAPFAASWLSTAAPGPSHAAPEPKPSEVESNQSSPSPMPPLFLTPQKIREENLSRAAAGMRMPVPAAVLPTVSDSLNPVSRAENQSGTPSPSATGSGIAHKIQQFESPSETGHPINFPYGRFTPVSSPVLVTLPSAGNESPSSTFAVHTVPVQNLVVSPQGVASETQGAAPSIVTHSSPKESAHEHGNTNARRSFSSASDADVVNAARDEANSASSGGFVDAHGTTSPLLSGDEDDVQVASVQQTGTRLERPVTPIRAQTPPLRKDGQPLGFIPGQSMARSTSGNFPIPSTPPTPPAVSDIVARFAVNTPDRPRMRTRPVSTMSPSPQLFQKLISHWQSTSDVGTPPSKPEPTPSTTESKNVSRAESSISIREPSNTADDTEKGEGSTVQMSEDVPSEDSGRSSPDVQNVELRKTRPHAGRRLAVRLPKSPVQQMPGIPVKDTLKSSSLVVGKVVTSEPTQIQPGPVKASGPYDGAVVKPVDHWRSSKRASELEVWDSALANRESVPISGAEPSSSEITVSTSSVPRRVASTDTYPICTDTQDHRHSQQSQQSMSPAYECVDRASSASGDGIQVQGEAVRVEKRRLDWLTQELLAARDSINEKRLESHITENDSTDQKEILILEKQDAESVVSAMKQILAERESELREARRRLSIAISGVSRKKSKSSRRSSLTNAEIDAKIEEKAAEMAQAIYKDRSVDIQDQQDQVRGSIDVCKFMERFDKSDTLTKDIADRSDAEMNRLWGEVQMSMEEKMMQMVHRRDRELAELKRELAKRQEAMEVLQDSRLKLVSQNAHIQAEATSAKQEKELIITQAAMEISQVQAQLVLVDKFSKKLHDTFKETEMLRAQVADSQTKMSSYAHHSGISAREAKELREAVLRAQEESDRWRQVAEAAKTEKREAQHRAEEMGRLYKSAAQPSSHGRYGTMTDDEVYMSERSHDLSTSRRTGTEHGVRAARAPTNDASAGSRVWNSLKNMVTLGAADKGQKASSKKPPRKPRDNRRHPQQLKRHQPQLQHGGSGLSAPYRSPQMSPRDFQNESYRSAIPSPPGSQYSADVPGASVGDYSAQSGSRSGTPHPQQHQVSASVTGEPQTPELGQYSHHQVTNDAMHHQHFDSF